MKKLLFVLAFAFVGQQAFSQMYIVTIGDLSIGGCSTNPYEYTLTKVDPTGIQTHVCIPAHISDGALVSLNQELNSIVDLGYQLIETSYMNGHAGQNNPNGGLIYGGGLNGGTSFIFAVLWTSSGLEEVPTTLNSFNISPNPANEFVNIILSYDLKGESEIVFISEAGYVYHKESIGSISKNETYNIDISKIPTGKYLVTIKNGKTYTTPQKLIIL